MRQCVKASHHTMWKAMDDEYSLGMYIFVNRETNACLMKESVHVWSLLLEQASC